MHVKIKRKWWAVAVTAVFALSLMGRYTLRLKSQLPWWHWDAPFDDEPSYSPQTVELNANDRRPASRAEEQTRGKVILIDRPLFGRSSDIFVDEDLCGGECLVTFNKSYRSVANVVLFHCLDLRWDDPANVTRGHSSQLFIFLCMENPWTTRRTRNQAIDFIPFKNVFNLTMSYRRDSDIYLPYFTIDYVVQTLYGNGILGDLESFLKRKTRVSAWVVSNCHQTKGAVHRMGMVKKLVSAGLKVDLFGKCFGNGDLWDEAPIGLTAKYKFYISFENAFHCRDYITEKVWHNALNAGTVPVIWGPRKTDVEKVLPLGSYIMAEDFASAEDLVDYLTFLDENDEEYKKFYRWWPKENTVKKTRFVRDFFERGYCEICKTLRSEEHASEGEGKTLTSVDAWWYGTESAACLAPRTLSEDLQFAINRLYLMDMWPSKIFYKLPLLAVVVFILASVCREYFTNKPP